MRAGELIHRLQIEVPRKVSNGMGGFEITWFSDADLVYAAIWPLRGSEPVVAKRLEGKLTHRIRIYYYDPLRLDARFKFGNRYFEIDHAIDPDERHIYLDVMVQERRSV